MAQRHGPYRAKEPVNADHKQQVLDLIYQMAASNMSRDSIAVKLGITREQFEVLMVTRYEGDYKSAAGEQVFEQAFRAGRAKFEEENAEHLDQILNNPETSPALKMKIARENLKTLENWAPATRGVRVQVEDVATNFEFQSYTEEEKQQIAEQVQEADAKED